MDSQDAAPAEPRRAPTPQGSGGSFKFCLFGVLVAFAALLITVGIVYMGIRSLSSEEGGWNRIDESLDFDERPAEWAVEFGVPYNMFSRYALVYLRDEPNHQSIMFYLDADPEVVELRFDEEANEAQRAVTGSGALVVQGRELRYIDYDSTGDDGDYTGRTVQLSEPDAASGTLVEFLRESNQPRITDDEVVRALAPFHIGPDR